jgi:hypothetical protein
MAIAIAGMLGYQLKPNFAHPYLAPNLNEFWRRWHMSLTGWFRDYVYFPLSLTASCAAGGALLLVTFLITACGTAPAGRWSSGAGCTARPDCSPPFSPWRESCSLAGNVLTFAFVCFAWIFFGRRISPPPPRCSAIRRARGSGADGGGARARRPSALVAIHVATYRIDLQTALAGTGDLSSPPPTAPRRRWCCRS